MCSQCPGSYYLFWRSLVLLCVDGTKKLCSPALPTLNTLKYIRFNILILDMKDPFHSYHPCSPVLLGIAVTLEIGALVLTLHSGRGAQLRLRETEYQLFNHVFQPLFSGAPLGRLRNISRLQGGDVT